MMLGKGPFGNQQLFSKTCTEHVHKKVSKSKTSWIFFFQESLVKCGVVNFLTGYSSHIVDGRKSDEPVGIENVYIG